MATDKKQQRGETGKAPPPRGQKRRPAATGPADAREGERIARRLARAGVASRREAEAMIAAGRVSVNGRVLTSPAVNVGDRDVILVDGQPLPARERTRLFLFHKPAGTITTNRDPEGRRTIFDVLPKDLPRLISVGRLDYATEGLLLLTNDGGLARVLELPATGWLRRYRVRVHGKPDAQALERLKDGIVIDGVIYGAIEAVVDRVQGSNAWLTVSLREGKNREVRNIMKALGLEVNRLIRVSYGPFQLADLPEGAILEIRGRTLRDQLGPRLIAAAGADFESEIRQPVPRAPLTAKDKDAGKATPKDKDKRSRARPAESAAAKPVKEERAAAKKPGPKPARAGDTPDKRGARAAKEKDAAPAIRTANVWRAPGARPLGPQQLKKKKAGSARAAGAGKPRSTRKSRKDDADRRR